MVDGRRTYDVLFELLDPKLVKFQFQMSTASRGFIPADYFLKYPGRFISMHLQDLILDATAKPLAPEPATATGAVIGALNAVANDQGSPPFIGTT